MAMLTLAAGALWADSYRERTRRPLPEWAGKVGNDVIFTDLLFVGSVTNAGIRLTIPVGHRKWIRFGVLDGRLHLGFDEAISNTWPTSFPDASFAGFAIRRTTASVIFDPDPTGRRPPRRGYDVWYVQAPMWFVCILAASYPAKVYLVDPLRQRRRRHRGQCPLCGYDLSQSIERCPECGGSCEY